MIGFIGFRVGYDYEVFRPLFEAHLASRVLGQQEPATCQHSGPEDALNPKPLTV